VKRVLLPGQAPESGANPYRDNIHPNEAGQRLIAEAILEGISRPAQVLSRVIGIALGLSHDGLLQVMRKFQRDSVQTSMSIHDALGRSEHFLELAAVH
jgi:phospholipase/lecithinase/hemolysin